MKISDREITILEATEEAQNKHGWLHGSMTIGLEQKHIDALLNGKMLAFDDDEYMTFVVMKEKM